VLANVVTLCLGKEFTDKERGLMNCPYCAELIADDPQFCPKCGSRLGVNYPAAPGAPPLGREQQKTSGKAIASLICGVFTCFLPASIAAIVLGHLSLSEIRKSAGRLRGVMEWLWPA
jgi:hypothetical protein